MNNLEERLNKIIPTMECDSNSCKIKKYEWSSNLETVTKRKSWNEAVGYARQAEDSNFIAQMNMFRKGNNLPDYTFSDIIDTLAKFDFRHDSPLAIYYMIKEFDNVDPSEQNNALLKMAMEKNWKDLVNYLKEDKRVIYAALKSNEIDELGLISSDVRDIFVF